MTGSQPIDRTPPREVFAELLAGAAGEVSVRPSPLASAYLVELLLERVQPPAEPAGDDDATLAEALLLARRQRGPTRIRRLRRLGDRALFVAGFFGESLNRSLVDLDYYRDVGRSAYGDLATALAALAGGSHWPSLFEELARRFGEFADVLAEVGDRTRATGPVDLLRLYERYALTGSERDRRRLARLGRVPPPRSRGRTWQ